MKSNNLCNNYYGEWMGIWHSRSRDLRNSTSFQARRFCFWCQNGRSFDDLYEPAVSTTITAYNKTETDFDKTKTPEVSKCRVLPEKLCVSFTTRSLSMVNSSIVPATSDSGQQQQQEKEASACFEKKSDDNISSNLLPYTQLNHDAIVQIIQRFPFSSLQSSSKYSSKWGFPKFRSRSFDILHAGRLNRVSRFSSHYATDNNKCKIKNASTQMTARPIMRSGIIRMKTTIEKLALMSVDTMAITALPLDCWLKERLKNWVQLSGHEGIIVPATDHTLWKKLTFCGDYNEGIAYRELMKDTALEGFVPRFYREVQYKNESFIEIEDLTALFDDPAIMDIKLGTRTFLESEVENTSRRNDLYLKMVKLNPDEPTEEEHTAKAITKMRYMQFREKESSTATLGFRIEAAKMPGGVLQKSFEKVKTTEDVNQALSTFFGAQASTAGVHILQRLKRLREAVQKSIFFRTHEVIGSSLLVMYDSVDASVWMIDFAKSNLVEKDSVNHRREWFHGNHEDGYFKGLDNLIEMMENLVLR